MPRLSLWKDGRHTNDFKFFDQRISEMFTMGGTGVLLHKYVGTTTQSASYTTTSNASANASTLSFANVSTFGVGQTVSGIGIAANTVVTSANTVANTVTISNSLTESVAAGSPVLVYWKDFTQPVYTNQSAVNIQDLLFLENRDRKYDTSVYTLRGIYQVNDNDFDLSQFGIFLSADTLYITFHLTDVVAKLGRKIMSGDVIELQHKMDYYPLDTEIPAALKRFYVVQDVTFASEGFSQSWWPHLLRIKVTPLVDSQEYKDILNQITVDGTNTPIGQIMSNYNLLTQINDAIINQAESDVPTSGFDTNTLYVEPLRTDDGPGDPIGTRTDSSDVTVDSTVTLTDSGVVTPDTNIPAYLGGDAVAPNGWPVTAATSFPGQPNVGDYVLRTDFVPNRLFRYDGRRWVKIEDNVRTNLTPGPDNQTQRSIFVNNTGTFVNEAGQTVPVRQSLSQALTPRADN